MESLQNMPRRNTYRQLKYLKKTHASLKKAVEIDTGKIGSIF